MTGIEQLLKESIEICKDQNIPITTSNVIDIFIIVSGFKESDARNKLYDYLFKKFSDSKTTNFDQFIESVFNEEDIQIKSDLKAIPERPVEDKEEIEEGEDSDSPKLPEDVDKFLETIGLKDLDEKASEVFLFRFRDIIAEYIEDEDVVDMMIYLLHSAKMGEPLSDGEMAELQDLVRAFTTNLNDQVKESLSEDGEGKFSKDEKIGIISTMVLATMLFGFGGLLAAGIFVAIASHGDDDYAKDKEDLTSDESKEKVESGEVPKEVEEDIKDKPKADPKDITLPEEPKTFFGKIKKKISDVKDRLLGKAKTEVKKQRSENPEASKDETPQGEEPKETSKEDEKAADAKDMEPNSYKKKWGKCPDGYYWDDEKNACIQQEKKSITMKKTPKKESYHEDCEICGDEVSDKECIWVVDDPKTKKVRKALRDEPAYAIHLDCFKDLVKKGKAVK